ncbi:MAG: hypothetical protein LUO93_12005 [Methanomicrobiales archaeon]|nr:hypothetical protein [Methanomicrobiales archaeon]
MNISVWCPVCNEEREHEILKEGVEPLVRCTICNHIHRIPQESDRATVVKTIVSAGEESRVCATELEKTELYRTGDTVVAECGEEVQSVEITGIEIEGRRVKRAKGSEILTLWTRAIREVTVKISLHEGRSTTPLYLNTQGIEEFEVGHEYQVGKRGFRVSHIKLRDDRFLRRDGQKALAREIKRIYAFRS